MKTKTLIYPAFFAFMLMIARLVWSPIDSEAASYSFAQLDPPLLNSKLGIGVLVVCFLPFLTQIKKPISALGFFPYVLLCLAGLSVGWSADVPTTLYSLAVLGSIFAYVMIMGSLFGPGRALALAWWFSSAVIIASALLCIIGDEHALMGGSHEGAWRGLFYHKNGFGPFIVIHALLTMYGRRQIGVPSIVAFIVCILDLTILFFTRSSTAIVAAAGGIAAGVIFLPISNRAARVVWRSLAVVGLTCSMLVVALNVTEVYDLLGKDPTMTGRSQMWAQVYDMTFRHKLGTGYGTGGGSQVSIELKKLTGHPGDLGVQSGYLTLALELGWVAVILFLFWIASSIGMMFFAVRASSSQALFASLAVEHLIESYSESFGGISPSWSLAILMMALFSMRANSPVQLFKAKRPVSKPLIRQSNIGRQSPTLANIASPYKPNVR